MIDFVEFWTICSANGVVFELNQLDQIKRYHKELLHWNEKVNLISRKDEDFLLERHIMHSLAILKYIDIPSKARCIDVGTGGGFPGIPLSIAVPDARFTLVDSIGKKIKVTSMLADHTGNRHLKVMNCRVEDLLKERQNIHNFDFIFARAVSSTAKIVSWVERLLKPKGQIVLLKGGDLYDEIEDAKYQHPDLHVKEIDISIVGIDWYKEESKKLLICTLKK